MLMCETMNNFNDPRTRQYNNPLAGNADLQESQAGNKEVQTRAAATRGPRSGLAVPQNYIPLPDGREGWKQQLAWMNGGGRPLLLEWCGNVEATRLQPTEFNTEVDAQRWRQGEWLRQKSRRRFSNKQILEQEIGKRFATNESAQAAVSQKQFKHPSSENRFYAFLKGMSAAFGSLE